MSELLWGALGFSVQVGIGLRFTALVGKGRILSRPLWRFRFFSPLIGYTMVLAVKTRLAQLLVLIVVYVPAMIVLRGPLWLTASFWTLVILWYGDDWLTGDDERWNRFLGWWRRWRAKRKALRRLASAR
jgi:hypothetical protein